MKRTFWVTMILASFLALGWGMRQATRVAQAQEETKTVKVDDFESALSGWLKLKAAGDKIDVDNESQISITNDAQQVKTGKGALFYSYEVAPNSVRLLAFQKALNLTGMKSLHFWVKGSATTVIVLGVHEKGGADYQVAFYCPANVWQEVAVNLDELTLDDASKDSNGKFDLDQIESLHVADLGSFLVNLLPDLKGSRVMWLDDMEFSSKAVALTTGVTKTAKGTSVHVVDNFESPVIRWSPVSIELSATPKIHFFDAPVEIDLSAAPDGGKQSLKSTYKREAMKVQGLLRNLEKVDLKKVTGLNLSLKTSRDGVFLVAVQEKDESRYQQIVELKSGDGWKQLSYPLSGFTLADDSKDENNKLDADQIKEISIADLTTLVTGNAGDENSLWMDEVQFTMSQ